MKKKHGKVIEFEIESIFIVTLLPIGTLSTGAIVIGFSEVDGFNLRVSADSDCDRSMSPPIWLTEISLISLSFNSATRQRK